MGPFPEPRDSVMKSTTSEADDVMIYDQAGSASARLPQFMGVAEVEEDRGMEGCV